MAFAVWVQERSRYEIWILLIVFSGSDRMMSAIRKEERKSLARNFRGWMEIRQSPDFPLEVRSHVVVRTSSCQVEDNCRWEMVARSRTEMSR